MSDVPHTLISHLSSVDLEHRIDFYVRVFVRVYTSKSEVKNSCLRRGYVYQSMDTPEFYVHPVSEKLACYVGVLHWLMLRWPWWQMGRMAHNKHQAAVAATPPAEGRYKIGGPIWSAPIHDGEWVAELLRRVVCVHLFGFFSGLQGMMNI